MQKRYSISIDSDLDVSIDKKDFDKLFNDIVNKVLLQVKPIKLRMEIANKFLNVACQMMQKNENLKQILAKELAEHEGFTKKMSYELEVLKTALRKCFTCGIDFQEGMYDKAIEEARESLEGE